MDIRLVRNIIKVIAPHIYFLTTFPLICLAIALTNKPVHWDWFFVTVLGCFALQCFTLHFFDIFADPDPDEYSIFRTKVPKNIAKFFVILGLAIAFLCMMYLVIFDTILVLLPALFGILAILYPLKKLHKPVVVAIVHLAIFFGAYITHSTNFTLELLTFAIFVFGYFYVGILVYKIDEVCKDKNTILFYRKVFFMMALLLASFCFLMSFSCIF